MVQHGGAEGASPNAAGGGPLEAALRRLALTTLDETNVDGILDLVVQSAVAAVPAADAASATSANSRPAGQAASPCLHAVEPVQDRVGRGPRPDVLERGRRYNGALAAESARWPEFSAAAVGAGFHAVLGLPLRHRERTTGALVLYSRSEAGFGPADVAAAEALARYSEVALANIVALSAAQMTAQFMQDGFVSRELIGQAQGILMARHACGSESAFEMLRYWSQSKNRKVRDIAAEVVAEYE